MSDKTFTVVGVSFYKGQYKVRFANDMSRVKVLTRGGHTDVRLFDLDAEMTQVEAVDVAAKLDMFQDQAAQDAFKEFNDATDLKVAKATTVKEPKTPKEPKEKKEPKINQEAKAIAEARAVAARDRELAALAAKTTLIVEPELEDEPF